MPTKKVTYDFYTFKCQSDQNALLNALENEIKLRNNEEINNISLFDFVARIWDIEKTNEGFYICNVEKINVQDEANIGDLQSKRTTIATTPNQGPLFDTAFMYNPKNEVIVLQRNWKGLTYKSFLTYLHKLTNNDEVKLEIIIDPDILVKLDKMDLVKKVHYTISNPTNLKFAENSNRGVNGDLEVAKNLLGNSMSVVIGSDRGKQLSLEMAKKKIKSLLKFPENISKLDVRGQVDENMETIHLVKHKVTHVEKFKLKKEERLTVTKILGALPVAYKAHETNLNRMYLNREEKN